MPRKQLFPEIAPHKTGMLPLDRGHRMYWEVSGNAKGIPVLFLHGGPGSGTSPVHRRFFHPTAYRIVLFDQRGAGKSTPNASITANTTQHLIADIEKLREHLGIEHWLLFGGSWGSTLALAYGEAHPERVLGFILRGVFLGRDAEIEWFLNGMGIFRPEAAAAFRNFLPKTERKTLLKSYLRRLKNAVAAVHLPAAAVWCEYERACATLLPEKPPPRGRRGAAAGDLALARIEAHYMHHRMFLEENTLLKGLDRIAHLPAIIVQGRYDLICPIRTAAELADLWPGAVLQVAEDAGHTALEPGILEALVQATEAFAKRG